MADILVALFALLFAASAGLVVLEFARRARDRRRVRDVLKRLVDDETWLTTSEPVGLLTRAVNAHFERDSQARVAASRLEQALGAMPSGAVITTGDGHAVYRNPAADAFLDGSHHQGRLVRAAVDELLAEALKGRGARREVEWFGPPKQIFAVSSQPLRGEGDTIIGAVGIIKDISEIRELEDIRRDFVANTTHELKTPVGAISILAETLADEDDPAVAKSLLARIQSEAGRLNSTIDDLLELSRIEHEGTVTRDPVTVDDAVREAIEKVRVAAERRAISVAFQPAGPHAMVPANPRQLLSAVLNVLENAVKHSDEGSSVVVAVSETPSSVEISVADNGPGIPKEDINRVFERFYRVDRSRARSTGGTGLGLSIVRHIMVNHGGTVRLTSKEGEGSTFTLVFPREVAPATETEVTGTASAPESASQ